MSHTEYVPSSKLEVKTAAINYPSARLGAITRKSNEIANLLKERTVENIKSVNFSDKIYTHFSVECYIELHISY